MPQPAGDLPELSGQPTAGCELRTDVLTGQQVIVAPARAERPQARGTEPPLARTDDPFAAGNEQDTPHERLALRCPDSAANAPGWQIRVVPNRFPALQDTPFGPAAVSPAAQAAETTASACLPLSVAGGVHEVVIECPDSVSRLADLSVAEIAAVLTAWQHRVRTLQTRPGIVSIAVFRNEGFSAGASLAHCHSQIMASEFWTPQLAQRHRRAAEHRRATGRDLVGDWLEAEVRDGRRLLLSTDGLQAVCPFASRTPWQVRLLPTQVSHFDFLQLPGELLRQLARMLRDILHAQEQCLGLFSFNLALVLPAVTEPTAFRWMLEILPRLSRQAGWELLTDVDIVTTAPERAAAALRPHCMPTDRPHVSPSHRQPLDNTVWRP